MRLPKQFFTLLAGLLLIGASHAQQSGVVPLNPPQPVENDGRVEVLEFFAYGCIHCYTLEPKLEEWIKKQPADVKVKRVPTPFLIRGFNSVPAFYALEALGVLDKMHPKLFDALNRDNVMLGNSATMNEWLAKNGVDPKKYEEIQKSFSVKPKIDKANTKTDATSTVIPLFEAYKVNSTPTFVVNGRYVVTNTGTPEQLFSTLDGIINAARSSAGGKSSAATPDSTAPKITIVQPAGKPAKSASIKTVASGAPSAVK